MLSASALPLLLLALSPVHAASAANAKIASAWYAGWHADLGFGLDKVPWEKYTHLTYSFAETTPDVNTLSLSGSDEPLLPQFVETAHKNNVKALVSLGGWTGSRWYSSNVGSSKNRTAFVKTVVNLANKYNLDGIDFDWEYPASQGIGCNVVSSNDITNFLSFLQELRKDSVGAKLILTAATGITPYPTPSGSVAPFSKVLDHIAIMNYDIWGSWSSSVGPNAPLNDTCAAPANQQGSAVSAVKAWSAAGMPPSQIVLGVASYGHSFHVDKASAFKEGSNQLAPYPPFDASNQPTGDAWDDPAGPDECGNIQTVGGNFDLWGLVAGGFLTSQATPAANIAYRFDDCSKTAYVYNTTSEVMVSFDDARAFEDKGQFIKSSGIAGFAMWEAGGDFNNILLDSIRKAGGYSS